MNILFSAILLVSAAFVSLACSSKAPPAPASTPSPTVLPAPTANRDLVQARVVRVLDGTTIEVESEGRTYRVRYLGVRVPENGPANGSGRGVGQEALDFNRFLVEGKTVELAKDTVDADQMGNLLRYVFIGGEMVNKTLLENGYASVADFPPTFQHQVEFAVAEENARTDRRGIWTRAQPKVEQHVAAQATPTAVGRFTGGTLPSIGLLGGDKKCDYSGTRESVIKGNVDARSGKRVYHVPGGLFYSTTVVDEARGDRWFCTEREAVAAGWHRSKR